jgi:hypothetical protein
VWPRLRIQVGTSWSVAFITLSFSDEDILGKGLGVLEESS